MRLDKPLKVHYLMTDEHMYEVVIFQNDLYDFYRPNAHDRYSIERSIVFRTCVNGKQKTRLKIHYNE